MQQRQSNIELCRILSILLVILVHSQFFSLGYPDSLSPQTVSSMFLQSLSIVGVNVFVLISGYFSIQLKLRSVLNFLYICIFSKLVLSLTGKLTVDDFLFISTGSWFVRSYLGLMLSAPILNIFAEHASQKAFKFTIISLLVFQTWFGWHMQVLDFNNGYSILSFYILYLLARYSRIYDLKFSKKTSVWMYVLCTVVLTGLESVEVILDRNLFMMAYINPIVILSAFSFLNIFLNLDIKYNKVINHIAKSTLMVLLLHNSSVVVPCFKEWFLHIFSLGWWKYALLLPLSIAVIFIVCVLIDQIRIYSFRFLEKSFRKHV